VVVADQERKIANAFVLAWSMERRLVMVFPARLVRAPPQTLIPDTSSWAAQSAHDFSQHRAPPLHGREGRKSRSLRNDFKTAAEGGQSHFAPKAPQNGTVPGRFEIASQVSELNPR